MCELCDNFLNKENRVRIMIQKCFVLREEVIYVFHENKYIPTIEKLSFSLVHVKIIGSMECGKTKNDYLHDNASNNFIKLIKDYAEKLSKTSSI